MSIQATLPVAADGYLCNSTVGRTLSVAVSGYLCLLSIVEGPIGGGGGGKDGIRPRYWDEVFEKAQYDSKEDDEMLQLLILATIYGLME